MATPTRWAPWIEQRASATGNATVNSTAVAVAVPGCSITITPHINTRILPMISADVECTTFAAGSILAVRLTISPSASPGTPNSAQVIYIPTTTGQRITLGQIARPWDLVKETTYAIALEGILAGAAGGVYLIRSVHTGISLLGLPNLHG